MGRPEILLVLQILHKNIIEGTLLLPLQKSAPFLLDFCEKLTPQLEFWRSPFSTKRQPKECANFCAPFSLESNGKGLSTKTLFKNYSLDIKTKRICFLPQTRIDSICHFLFSFFGISKVRYRHLLPFLKGKQAFF
jgi:hypothetical protein